MEEAWVGEVDRRCCGQGGAGKAGGMCDINPLLNGQGGGKEIQHLWWVGMVWGGCGGSLRRLFCCSYGNWWPYGWPGYIWSLVACVAFCYR